MSLLKRCSGYLFFCLTMMAICPQTMAQVSLHDFGDGTLGGWENMLDLSEGQPFGPTQFAVEDGRMIMSSNGPAPSAADNPNSFFCVSWSESETDPTFSNGFVRATVEPLVEGIEAGILLRENLDAGADYDFWRDTANGMFYFGRFDSSADPQFELLASTEIGAVPYEAGERWIMEAGAVGNQISLKYWAEGGVEPPEPQLTAIDDAFPPFGDGTIVSLASQHFSADPIALSVAFDDVQFSVPEPVGLGPLSFYSVSLWVLSRRRRDVDLH